MKIVRILKLMKNRTSFETPNFGTFYVLCKSFLLEFHQDEIAVSRRLASRTNLTIQKRAKSVSSIGEKRVASYTR